MKTLHTQGEWYICDQTETQIFIASKERNARTEQGKGSYVCHIKQEREHFGINEQDKANAQLIAAAPELLQMVYDLKKCIERLTRDEMSQEDRDKEAQWIGEAHELLQKINPNYYYNANEQTISQPTIIEEEDIDNWKRWQSMELKEGASIEVSERIYYEMLGCVPPRLQIGTYFEVGEAHHHTNEGKAIHHAFWIHKERFYSGYPTKS